jgi:hypothetical protein
MLRDGQFIKEEPPAIGAHWVPTNKDDTITPEERFAQNLLLGVRDSKTSVLSKVLGRVLGI